MSADLLRLPCPSCDTLNRAPRERLLAGAKGRCGRCGKPLFEGRPLALDQGRLRRHLKESDLPLLIDFWAAWCGPCHAMAPHFERAAAEFEPSLRLAKIDTEAAPQLAEAFGIRSIPTLVLFRGGKEVARQSGALDGAGIRRFVESHLS